LASPNATKGSFRGNRWNSSENTPLVEVGHAKPRLKARRYKFARGPRSSRNRRRPRSSRSDTDASHCPTLNDAANDAVGRRCRAASCCVASPSLAAPPRRATSSSRAASVHVRHRHLLPRHSQNDRRLTRTQERERSRKREADPREKSRAREAGRRATKREGGRTEGGRERPSGFFLSFFFFFVFFCSF
jgi:hypothetical protein